MTQRNSQAVLWLERCAFTVVVWVQSLVRELKSHKLHGITKKMTQSVRILGGSGPWDHWQVIYPQSFIKCTEKVEAKISLPNSLTVGWDNKLKVTEAGYTLQNGNYYHIIRFRPLGNHQAWWLQLEIKTHFLLRRKGMTNLDNMLKSKHITLLTNFHLVKVMGF